MPGLFITATGTDVGKTYVASALIRAGRRAGIAMNALKPILTGFVPAQAVQSDAGLLLASLGLAVTAETVASISPWRFRAPLSPDMAAALEGRPIDFSAVVEACRAVIRPDRLTLIEGIGGVMVPLDSDHTILDLIVAVDLPFMLVTGSALGALSHCLTAYEVLRAKTHAPALIVLNESAGANVPLAATRDTLTRFLAPAPIVVCPRNADDASHDGLLRSLLAIPGLPASAELRHKA